jgi:predicted DCC family thiol-disulfide oxidoreductase YuxK
MSNEPAASRDGPVIVFDGVCVLCNGWVRFLLRRDRGRYRFAPMQSSAGRALLVAHGLDADDPSSFLLLEQGRAFTDSDAIVRVLAGLGGAWKLAALLAWVPRAVRDPLYRLMARNRYRWFGTTSCTIPSESQRTRFLQ